MIRAYSVSQQTLPHVHAYDAWLPGSNCKLTFSLQTCNGESQWHAMR